MELSLPATTDKEAIFTAVGKHLAGLSLGIASVDAGRPWGGFFVMDESQTDDFVAEYFSDYDGDISRGGRLSPKILVVSPGARLSWQYHDRREELWKVIHGPVGVCISPNDDLPDPKPVGEGETVQFGTGIRHRLIGLDGWGVVAEIWQHTDPELPSDESDIVRVQDDYGR
ncbi:MAG TPA: hypothetical protein VF572_06105 [Candidatus Saccharimonadales bacterium]|jgi:mannose-6-phosphate isomerase-like protein (cupin superfamily)